MCDPGGRVVITKTGDEGTIESGEFVGAAENGPQIDLEDAGHLLCYSRRACIAF